jgi:hypothetical protein
MARNTYAKTGLLSAKSWNTIIHIRKKTQKKMYRFVAVDIALPQEKESLHPCTARSHTGGMEVNIHSLKKSELREGEMYLPCCT